MSTHTVRLPGPVTKNIEDLAAREDFEKYLASVPAAQPVAGDEL